VIKEVFVPNETGKGRKIMI